MTIKKNNRPPVGGNAPTANNNRNNYDDTTTVSPFIIPIGDSNRRNTNSDGLDWLRKPSTDLPGNVIVNRTDISMLGPDGRMRVVDTYNPMERLREKQMGMPQYDGRYEGQSDGDPLDRSIHSSSGLRIGKPRNNNDNNSDTVQSSGVR